MWWGISTAARRRPPHSRRPGVIRTIRSSLQHGAEPCVWSRACRRGQGSSVKGSNTSSGAGSAGVVSNSNRGGYRIAFARITQIRDRNFTWSAYIESSWYKASFQTGSTGGRRLVWNLVSSDSDYRRLDSWSVRQDHYKPLFKKWVFDPFHTTYPSDEAGVRGGRLPVGLLLRVKPMGRRSNATTCAGCRRLKKRLGTW